MLRVPGRLLRGLFRRATATRCEVRALSTASPVAPSSESPQRYDVVVVGAGVVGLSLAVRVASSPCFQDRSVAVIEAREPTVKLPAELASDEDVDLRVFAIAKASSDAFQDMGVWDDMVASRVVPYSTMQVWDSAGDGFVSFDSSLVGHDNLGHIVENKVLHSALYRRLLELQDQDRVDILCPTSVRSLEVPSAGLDGATQLAQLELENGSSLECELVVAADGGNSRVKQLCNVGSWGWDYDQRGLVCVVKTSVPNHTAWQRFMPSGPVAILPLWDDLNSIVWSTSHAEADRLAKVPEEQFLQELNAMFTAPAQQVDVPPVLEPFHNLASTMTRNLTNSPACTPFRGAPEVIGVQGPRASFPLRFSHTNTYYKPRVAFIGDAAHTTHPLAGQGMNLGIADANDLSKLLEEASVVGQDMGSTALLESYAKRRKPHNLGMMLGLDVLKATMAAEPGFVSDMRNLGMGVINSVPFLKKQMAAFAMGNVPVKFPR